MSGSGEFGTSVLSGASAPWETSSGLCWVCSAEATSRPEYGSAIVGMESTYTREELKWNGSKTTKSACSIYDRGRRNAMNGEGE